MASPFIHLVVADAVAPQVGLPTEGLPLFFFGSVAPDADKLGLCTREASHFWSFSEDVSGALKLLRAYPELAAAHLSSAERAFVAGYLCHLVTDEQWMLVIYRPFFGRRSPYGGSADGVELQWALHTVLEQRLIEDAPRINHLVGELERSRRAPLPPDLTPFVSLHAFEIWRDNVVGQAALAPGPARARHMHAGRQAHTADQIDDPADRSRPIADAERLEAVLQRHPPLLPKAASYVPRAAVADFERRAAEESVTALCDYLAGQPLRPPRGTAPPTWRPT